MNFQLTTGSELILLLYGRLIIINHLLIKTLTS